MNCTHTARDISKVQFLIYSVGIVMDTDLRTPNGNLCSSTTPRKAVQILSTPAYVATSLSCMLSVQINKVVLPVVRTRYNLNV